MTLRLSGVLTHLITDVYRPTKFDSNLFTEFLQSYLQTDKHAGDNVCWPAAGTQLSQSVVIPLCQSAC